MPKATEERELVPVIVDIGKTKKSRVDDLKNGRGRLMDEVRGIVQDFRVRHADDLEGRDLLPLVLIYRKKRKRRYLTPFDFFPFPRIFDDDDDDD